MQSMKPSSPTIHWIQSNLLWIDCVGGWIVGIATLACHGLLANLYGISEGGVLYLGTANLVYGCGSFLLARLRRRPLIWIRGLAVANMVWGLQCWLLLVLVFPKLTLMGKGQLLLEGAYVFFLGWIEWKYQDALADANAFKKEQLPP